MLQILGVFLVCVCGRFAFLSGFCLVGTLHAFIYMRHIETVKGLASCFF